MIDTPSAASWFTDPDPARFSKKDLVHAGISLTKELADLRAKLAAMKAKASCGDKASSDGCGECRDCLEMRAEAAEQKLKEKEAELAAWCSEAATLGRRIDRLRQMHEAVEGPTQTALRVAGEQVTELRHELAACRASSVYAERVRLAEENNALAARVLELKSTVIREAAGLVRLTPWEDGAGDVVMREDVVEIAMRLKAAADTPASPAVVAMYRTGDAFVEYMLHVSAVPLNNTAYALLDSCRAARKAAGRG